MCTQRERHREKDRKRCERCLIVREWRQTHCMHLCLSVCKVFLMLWGSLWVQLQTWISQSHAYLGWEHKGWELRAPPRWCRPNTDCCWREKVWVAGAEYCCPNRLILLGLTEPAGRGTWWVRSGRIKCCLEIAQGIGRRGQGRKDTPQSPEIHKHTCIHNGQMRHPSPRRHLHRHPPHTHNHTERETDRDSSQKCSSSEPAPAYTHMHM